MTTALHIYHSITRQKELFIPETPGFIGMYVCGPTVYNDVHLGNCRTFVSFDIIYRYLQTIGYQVRYVRNITDVGHLLDDGEDRMSKGARLEKKEPMEVAQKYTVGFHNMMRIFQTLPPSIEPRATGHIPEQIEMVETILKNGLAYIKNGSVYFDTQKYMDNKGDYGVLSGRKIDELLSETRDNLKNQSEKNHPADFAIWMKASDEHIMRWNSPWGIGFPGWHLECSAMSLKYLGEVFDIHGGGNDLKFPHHENEIAQNMGSCQCKGAKYWLHTNMLLLNGKKMSKSDGNTISPEQLFIGDSEHISKSYSPMVVKFFMLQCHYRSTLDLTDAALLAAEKGYKRLMEAYKWIQSVNHPGTKGDAGQDTEIEALIEAAHLDMADDFNTPKALSRLFELVNKLNSLKDKHIGWDQISPATFDNIKQVFSLFINDIFAVDSDVEGDLSGNQDKSLLDGLMNLIIQMRNDARLRKDWATADLIRDALKENKVELKDGKDGSSWQVTES
ncbi:MAG: cysteine--tRNA ligase [Saprospiraceae bacterium]|jgi:cysteinyl-tRNA synthetase|nr:cysteine--tRNA ligase [Saprospiraceae bacterium]